MNTISNYIFKKQLENKAIRDSIYNLYSKDFLTSNKYTKLLDKYEHETKLLYNLLKYTDLSIESFLKVLISLITELNKNIMLLNMDMHITDTERNYKMNKLKKEIEFYQDMYYELIEY